MSIRHVWYLISQGFKLFLLCSNRMEFLLNLKMSDTLMAVASCRQMIVVVVVLVSPQEPGMGEQTTLIERAKSCIW